MARRETNGGSCCMMWLVLVLAAMLIWLLLIAFSAEGSALDRRVAAAPILLTYLAISALFAWHANWDVLDRLLYQRDLEVLQHLGPIEAYSSMISDTREPLYLGFAWVASQISDTHQVLFACIAIFAGILQLIALAALQNSRQISIVWILTVSMGLYTGYVSVIARQGLSMALIFLGVLVWLIYGRRAWAACILAAAALFHWSAIPVVVLLAVFLMFPVSRRILLGFWVVFAGMFVLSLNRVLLEPLSVYIPSLAAYTSEGLAAVYESGTNRTDFLIFSGLILLCGLVADRYLTLPAWYASIVNVFIFLNLYFVLFGFIYYSDRLAAYSWYFAPIILALPVAAIRGAVGRILFFAICCVVLIYSVAWGPVGELINLTSS
ncbi:EpsG family protein [Arthrobacter pigmenti]